MENGIARKKRVIKPARCMERAITSLLMKRLLTLGEAAATFLLRYGTNRFWVYDFQLVFAIIMKVTIISQDYCGDGNGTFRVVTESIQCGATESICSTSIKLYLGVC